MGKPGVCLEACWVGESIWYPSGAVLRLLKSCGWKISKTVSDGGEKRFQGQALGACQRLQIELMRSSQPRVRLENSSQVEEDPERMVSRKDTGREWSVLNAAKRSHEMSTGKWHWFEQHGRWQQLFPWNDEAKSLIEKA